MTWLQDLREGMKAKRLQMWYNPLYGAIMAKKQKVLKVKEMNLHLVTNDELNYISLTDMLESFGDNSIIQNWMRYRKTENQLSRLLTPFLLSVRLKLFNI